MSQKIQKLLNHMRILNKIGVLMVVEIALIGSTVRAQNIIYDPSFEQQLTAPNPDPNGVQGWATFGGANFSQTYAHTGSWSMYTPNSGGGYSVPGAYEVFAATAGQTYTLSGWVYTPDTLVPNSNDFGILQISFFSGAPPSNYGGGTGLGSDGVNIGDPNGGGGVSLPEGTWTYASVTATTPANTQSIGAYLLDINADANSDLYFDDISLTAVPEPTSMALAGLSGLAGLAMIRRKRTV
jgi:hypothetical protein